MNGLELVAALKRDPALKQVPVLLLTARAGQEEVVSGSEQGGADDYVTQALFHRPSCARASPPRGGCTRPIRIWRWRMDELLATRDQLVEAEKLALAGRLARAVAREIRAPLESLLATVTSVGVLASSPDAAQAIARVGELGGGPRAPGRAARHHRAGADQRGPSCFARWWPK